MNSLTIFLILVGIFLIYTNRYEFYKLDYIIKEKKVKKENRNNKNKNWRKRVRRNKLNKEKEFIKKYVKEDYILEDTKTDKIKYNEISINNNKFFKNFFGKPDEWSNLHGYKINLKKQFYFYLILFSFI